MVLVATTDERTIEELAKTLRCDRDYASDLDAAMAKARRLQPKVIVLDVRIGGNHARAVEAVPILRKAAPCAEVVVITRRPSRAEVEEIERLGAYDYVDGEEPSSVIRLLRAIRAGQRRAEETIAAARARRAAKARRQVH